MGRGAVTVHGMRSSFRDWAAETTGYANHVVEMALGHAIGSKVEVELSPRRFADQAGGADAGLG